MSSPSPSVFSYEALYRLTLAAESLPDVEECGERFITALYEETGLHAALWLREGDGYERLSTVPESPPDGPVRFPADVPLSRTLQATPYLVGALPDPHFEGVLEGEASGTAAALRLGLVGILTLHAPDGPDRLTEADLNALLPIARHLTSALEGGLRQIRREAESDQDVSASRLHLLHAVLAQQTGTTSEQLERALALGTELLGLDIGIVSRVETDVAPPDGGLYTVMACYAPGTELEAGQTFPFEATYCAITFEERDVVAIEHMAEGEYAAHPCYEAFHLESYIGIPVHVDGALYGTVNFSGAQPRTRPFSETDRDVLRLLGPWVGALLARERADIARLRSEARLASVIDQAPLILYTLDRDGIVTLSEGRGLKDLGLEPGQVVGASVFELYTEVEGSQEALQAALRGEPTEWTSNVGDLWYESKAMPLFDADRHPDGVIAVSYDVTARYQAERALQDTMARLRRVFSAVPDALVLADPDRSIDYLNPAGEHLFGWRRDDVKGQKTQLLYANPDDHAKQGGERYNPDVDENEDRLKPYLADYKRQDGTTFLGETVGAPIHSEDGTVLGYVGFIRDVTEREAQQQALFESNERLERLFDAAPYAVGYADADRTFQYVNPAYEELFGYSADEFLGKTTRFLYADQSGFDETGQAQFSANGTESSEPRIVAFQRKNGSTFLGEIVGASITDASGEVMGYIGFIRDVTERESIRQAEEEATRAKERFLANMSHEMRTPLNAVLGLSHLLRETPLNDDQTQLLRGIGTAADSLLALIDDLLDFARLEAGKLPFEAVPFRPIELLHDLLRMLRPRADEKGITLRLDLDSAVPETLIGDPNRLRQILMNLIANAVKFTEIGSVVVRVTRLGDPKAHGVEGSMGLRFDVVDTGIGIPSEQQDKIFNAFTQARTDSARTHGGTGLGLAIVKELTERQGGLVSVQSREGIGSTLSVVLPFELLDVTTPAQAVVTDGETTTSELEGVRVLLVEDNAMNRFVATRLLEKWDVTVATANNGREAVQAIAGSEGNPYDLVLMDLQMPEMDGIEATRRIREELGLSPTVLPVVALTASVLASQRTAVLSAGFNDFILKPFEPQDLRARLGAHLGLNSGDGLPASASVNPSLLERSTLGDPAVTTQLIDMFCAEMPVEVEALTNAVSRSAWTEVRMIAHKAKSQAGYIGAQPLAEALRDIERRIDEQRFEGLAERVEDAVRRAFEAMRELMLLRRRVHAQPSLPEETGQVFSGPRAEA